MTKIETKIINDVLTKGAYRSGYSPKAAERKALESLVEKGLIADCGYGEYKSKKDSLNCGANYDTKQLALDLLKIWIELNNSDVSDTPHANKLPSTMCRGFGDTIYNDVTNAMKKIDVVDYESTVNCFPELQFKEPYELTKFSDTLTFSRY